MGSMRNLLTTRGRSFVGAGATLAVSGVVFGFRDLTRFGILLVALPLLSTLLVRTRGTRMRIERRVSPDRVSVGQTARVALSFENVSTSATPVFLAEERLDYVLGDRPRFVVGRIAPRRVHTVEYTVRSRARGRQRLGPLGVQVQDPFGLANRNAVLEGHSELVVLPVVAPLGSSRHPSSGVGSEGEQAHLIALHGEDDVTVRDFREGDDLRRIHWPSTARTGEIMVRQEDRPAQRRAIVVLDPRPEAHGGAGPTGSFEWAVTAAASVAAHLNLFGYAVHLVCAETASDGRASQTLTTEEVLDVLAVTEPRPRGAVKDEILTAAQGLAASGGFVVAILGPRDAEVTSRLASLRQPGTTGLAFVLDSRDFGPSTADEVGPHVDALRLAGWRAVSVSRDETVAHAWAVLNAAAVGGGR
jgi:uncharacterized protein (DUF58 family)